MIKFNTFKYDTLRIIILDYIVNYNSMNEYKNELMTLCSSSKHLYIGRRDIFKRYNLISMKLLFLTIPS